MTKAKDDTPARPEETWLDKLTHPFPIECVEWRAQTVDRTGRRALALAYIDARSVMARLDEALGPTNWQDSYRYEGNRIVCRLELRINGEWVAKEDGSGDTNFEGEKGGISGAFKRAAVKWGIGRYLYDVDALWADCDAYESGKSGRDGKKKWVFKDWTDKGLRDLDQALQRAPGPRSTGKPATVEVIEQQIRDAQSIEEVRNIYRQHYSQVPLEYRREVLTQMETRKSELRQEEADDDRHRDDDRSRDRRDDNNDDERNDR